MANPKVKKKDGTVAVIPLLTHHDNAVALAVETDPVLDQVVALVGRNMTDHPVTYRLTRPVGDAFTGTIPAGTTAARRVLVTPIAFDRVTQLILDAGVNIWLAGG